jgi:carbonic anhydrase/acetyltransferase-like protein (isoleucine patch superfamily)
MPFFSFEGASPQVHADAFIAPTATLVGDVRVEANASIWYGVVLRADYAPIVIRQGANVQDGSVLHGDLLTEVGPGVTIGHACVVHGAVLEEECLIGNGTIVLDGARVGSRSLVAAHSLVAAGASIPPGVLAAGAPAVVKRALDGAAAGWVSTNPAEYQRLARRHAAGIQALDAPVR